MKPNKVETLEHYQSIVGRYSSKEGASNDYLQREVESLIHQGLLSEYSDEHNAYLFVQKPVGCRMYYYINDFSHIPDFSDMEDMVVEILYRGEAFYPQQEIEFLHKSGFKTNLIRDQYSGVYKDLTSSDTSDNIHVRLASSLEEVSWACDLFNDSFDALSGDFIPTAEYETLLNNKSIWIAVDKENNLLGTLHQSFVGKVACISHVAVTPESRGKHVGQTLLNAFVESNKETERSRYMFWVQQQNTAAVSMYQKKGFKYAGKSTISLIK